MLLFALCGHALTALECRDHRPIEPILSGVWSNPLAPSNFRACLCRACLRHTHSPSFCCSCRGRHSRFSLRNWKSSQLSHFTSWTPWIFWGSAIPQIQSSYQPQVLQVTPRAGTWLQCAMSQGEHICLVCYCIFRAWDNLQHIPDPCTRGWSEWLITQSMIRYRSQPNSYSILKIITKPVLQAMHYAKYCREWRNKRHRLPDLRHFQGKKRDTHLYSYNQWKSKLVWHQVGWRHSTYCFMWVAWKPCKVDI